MSAYDVIVVGEALVELHSTERLTHASSLRLSFSGDALNAAAAAAAARAHPALLTLVGDDDLGDALMRRLEALGVDGGLVRRTDRPNGLYLVVSDTTGDREFVYWRTDSAASQLGRADVERHLSTFVQSPALIVSGISAVLSPGAEEAILFAVRTVADSGGHVTYDPNFRSRLTTSQRAGEVLREVAPKVGLLTPSCPGDSLPLLDTTDPAEALERGLALGAGIVAVTAGTAPVVVGTTKQRFAIPIPTGQPAVDATGAGDVFAGTTTARLVLGDRLETALKIGVAAAALSTTRHGGTGYLPSLEESQSVGRTLVPVWSTVTSSERGSGRR